MHTLMQGWKERNLMGKLAEELAQEWELRLSSEGFTHNHVESIVNWLIGVDRELFETATPEHREIRRQAMDYRYRILRQRYLGLSPQQAYKNLMQRLGGLAILRNKIRTWVSMSRDRQRAVVDVLEEVIQELLNSDRYIQQQISWISKSTNDSRLRNSLLLATVEEYCLRPIRSQPLLVYRFVNYLRRSQRGGVTQVPEGDLVKLVSDTVTPDEGDAPLSLLDTQAVSQYQEQQEWEEQQSLRTSVKSEFANYLEEKVGIEAVRWLELHLQGKSQEAIAIALDMPIKQVYRLREKISYHAVNVFGIKVNPNAVQNWLQTSPTEHSLGLTPSQLEKFLATCTSEELSIIEAMKNSEPIEAIAKKLGKKTNQVTAMWTKIYLAAQQLRTQ
ncbi:HetZ-related protein 2 [Merismopedia glauca]|uniref:HetZ-related protein 2 n=2 Tax=Merismopedia TaxID=53402 RepID=A0A2T1C3Z1_9CYAN|nr:HetZ-related protein 2 [Merismopedia glauca]PSB02944.1 hypothetical protein C7B64_10895 [Merismopedia glauca CCAP 1448/3]